MLSFQNDGHIHAAAAASKQLLLTVMENAWKNEGEEIVMKDRNGNSMTLKTVFEQANVKSSQDFTVSITLNTLLNFNLCFFHCL